MLFGQHIFVLARLYVREEKVRVTGFSNSLSFPDEPYHTAASELTNNGYIKRIRDGYRIRGLGQDTITPFLPPFKSGWPFRTMDLLRKTAYFKPLSKKIRPGLTSKQYAAALFRMRRRLVSTYHAEHLTVDAIDGEFRVLLLSLPRKPTLPLCSQCETETHYLYINKGMLSVACPDCNHVDSYLPSDLLWKTAHDYWTSKLPLSVTKQG